MFGTVFEKIDKSSSSMGLNSGATGVAEHLQQCWDHLQEEAFPVGAQGNKEQGKTVTIIPFHGTFFEKLVQNL